MFRNASRLHRSAVLLLSLALIVMAAGAASGQTNGVMMQYFHW